VTGEHADGAIRQLVAPLLDWYDQSRRILPWREQPTPYRVWISEIMLQQTRVEAVRPYYERFLEALPDVAHLARVSEEQLLKLWEGLGYYNRARNLKRAAQQIQRDFGGELPGEYEALMELPGIGRYTAGAIASIAFGKAVPAVDGNVLRVMARVMADERDIGVPKVKREVEGTLAQVMPGERAGDFNQALMELGALICLPGGKPQCEACPWRDMCKAKEQGRVLDYPRKSAKRARSIEEKTVLIIQDGDRVALRKRPPHGLLAGLYEFPSLPGHVSEKEVLSYLNTLGYKAIHIQHLEDARHIFTHREWHMTGYAVRVDELERPGGAEDFIFAERGETEEKYPIPSAFARYAAWLQIRLGKK